jgi:hypothetical protein
MPASSELREGWIFNYDSGELLKTRTISNSLGREHSNVCNPGITDRCLGGERCVLKTPDIEHAKLMVATLDSAGFASCVRYNVPPVRQI